MTLHLQLELERRLSKAKTLEEKVKAIEFILRRALSRIEDLPYSRDDY
jgi:hypothetical protein